GAWQHDEAGELPEHRQCIALVGAALLFPGQYAVLRQERPQRGGDVGFGHGAILARQTGAWQACGMHTVRWWAMGMGLPAWLAVGSGAAQTPPMQPDIPAAFTVP